MGRCVFWQPIRSDALAYVLGVLVGDGNVRGRASSWNSFRITLEVCDRVFAEQFSRALDDIGLNPHKLYVVRERRPNRKERYLAQAANRFFSDWYLQLTIQNIVLWISGHEDDFLRGLWESEGHLIPEGSYYDIVIGMTRKEVVDLVEVILLSWGLHPKRYAYNDKRKEHKTMFRVCLFRSQEVRVFLGKIKPCIRNAQNANPEPSKNMNSSGRV